MSLFPPESHSFSDLESADGKPIGEEPVLSDRGLSFAFPPEAMSQTTPGVDAGQTEEFPSQQRVAPVMPVMPTVPDQLEKVAQFNSGAVEPEPEWIAPAKELSAENENSTGFDYAPAKRHWGKLVRFLILETIALSALLVFAKLEVEERFAGSSLTYLLYGAAMFIAAAASALIPVIFYALPPRLPPAPPR
jgi:hypothetical protein